ncbi:choice-of-anchor D domain-containing protein [Archangium primigenium]|uniref:choice-of-anchor D domain-containing protein n=1 Tax=[Archangium] primigenium TaxID=2792470 RepID=UPI001956D900|nr:choice-of-anchor D domain-containing protein [Archangium primigenium]
MLERHIKSSVGTALNFGFQQVGTTSIKKKILLTNDGEAPLKITKIAKVGGGRFNITKPLDLNATITVQPDSKPGAVPAEIEVEFAPDAEQSFDGQIQITSDATAELPLIDLAGEGIPYATVVDTEPIAFGKVRATDAVTQGIVVRNVGANAISFSPTITGNNAFSVALTPAQTPPPISLAPGASTTLTVQYLASDLPAADGVEVTAQLDLNVANDPDFPGTPIQLTGTSIKPRLTMSLVGGLQFGPVRAETSRTMDIVVSNEGTGPLTVDSIGLPTDNAFVILQKPADGTVLKPKSTPADPGSSMTLQVRFDAPTSATVDTTALARSGTIALVNTDKTLNTFTVPVAGTAVKPKLVLSVPGGFAFGPVRAETSQEMDVVVRNDGTGPLTLNSIGLPTDSAFVILQKPADGKVLKAKTTPADPDSSATFRVRFDAPTSATVDTTAIPRSGTIALVNTDSAFNTFTLPLSGTAVKPKLVLSVPGGFVFGPVRAETSKLLDLVVSNEGTGPLTVDSFGTPTDNAFTVTRKPADGTVLKAKTTPANPDSSMTIQVRFDAPTSSTVDTTELVRAGTLAVVNTDKNLKTFTLPMTGSAVKPKLRLNPASGFAFGTHRAGTSPELEVVVSNDGTGPLLLDSIGAPTDSSFVLTQQPANGTVLKAKSSPADPGSSATFRVRFDAPTAEPLLPRAGEIALVNRDRDLSGFTLPVSGTPVAPKVVMTSGGLLDFKDRPVGSDMELEVTVSNEGNGPIVLATIGPPTHEAYTITQKPPNNTELKAKGEAGSSVKIKVNFHAPEDTGTPVLGSVVLGNTDPTYKNSLKIDLRGRGVRPRVSTVSKLEFGEVRAGGVGETRNVKIDNTGSGSAFFYDVFTEGDTAYTLEPAIPRGTELEVPPGGKTLTVRFRPTQESSALLQGYLNLFSANTEVASQRVSLEGSGVKPQLQVTTGKRDFGKKNVGGPMSTLTIPVRNMGTGKLRFSSLQTTVASGVNPFSVSPSTDFELTSAQGEQLITVGFTPAVLGDYEGNLVFQTNDPDHALVTIPLSGGAQKLLRVHSKTDTNSLTLDFGDVRTTTTAERTFTVTNDGSSDIHLQGLQFSNGAFTGPSIASVVLNPSRPSIDIKVTFAPSVTGLVNESVTLLSDANNVPQPRLTLIGKGTQPRIKLYIAGSPTEQELDFGNVSVNTRSPRELTVKNEGDAPLTLGIISIIDSSVTPPPFDCTDPSTKELQPGAEVTVPVSFRPTENGDYSARLQVASNAAEGTVRFNLSGKGQSANITLPSRLTFAATQLNHMSAAAQFTIGNSGKSALSISGLDLPSDFVLVSPITPPTATQPWTIDGSAVKQVQVAFNPSLASLGNITGPMKVYSNAINATGGFSTVTLEGRGIDGIALVGREVTFIPTDVGTSRTERVRVENQGEHPLVLKSATLTSNSTPPPFSVHDFKSNYVLLPNKGNYVEFDVQFKPEYRGNQAGVLVIETDSESYRRPSLAVSGQAKGPEAFLPTMAEGVDFGKINVKAPTTSVLTVVNTGESPLNISRLVFTRKPSPGDTGVDDTAQIFTVDRLADGSVALPMVIAPNDSKNIPLKFQPATEGKRTAILSVVSNAREVSTEARGEGTAPKLELLPAEGLTFRGILLDRYSQPQTVTIKNEGSGSLHIRSIVLSDGGDVFSLQHADLATPYRLDPGEDMAVTVRFKPIATRQSAFVQMVVTTDDARPLIKSINLDGRGTSEALSVDSRLEFGRQLINTPSYRYVRITNGLIDPATFVKATMASGVGCSQFLPDPEQNRGFTLAGLEEAELRVIFTPSAVGALAAPCTLRLDFGLGQSGNKEVTLTGEGVASTLSVSKAAVDFGSVTAGGPKRTEGFYIRNELNDSVTLAVEESPGTQGERFKVNLEALKGKVLAAQEALYVSVEYEPLVATSSLMRLMFGTTSPSQQKSVEVTLKGEAAKQVLNVNRSSLNFGQVDVSKSVESEVVLITNNSSQSQRVLVSVKEAGASVFHVAENDSVRTFDLGPTGSDTAIATFRVLFKPKEVGETKDEVQIRLQDSVTPEAVIPVEGVGRILTGIGSGCSASGVEWGSAGMVTLLTLLGMHARRRRRE